MNLPTFPAIDLHSYPASPTRSGMTWNDRFLALFDRCVGHYQAGNRDFETYFDTDDRTFLSSIGHKTREFFDFVEDFCDEGAPTVSTALLIAAVRRDYFHSVQKNKVSKGRLLTRADVPSFEESLEGMKYLPRIIAKARAKLSGELDPDLMYCCGGDRNFLRKHGAIHPADFLRQVWAAKDDDLKIAGWVVQQGA